MKPPITLHEDENAKVVQISGDYHPEWNSSIEEVKAIFLPQTVEIHYFQNGEGKKHESITLTTEATDAFSSAWITFQAEQHAKQIKEQRRIASIVVEARALVEGHPISITEHPETETNNLYWEIRSSKLDTIRYTAYRIEQLLPYAQDAIAVWLRHLEAQVWIDEAHKIAESCPAIGISGNCAPWHVNIPEPDIYGEWATTPEHLLERMKQAKTKYEEWQTEWETNNFSTERM